MKTGSILQNMRIVIFAAITGVVVAILAILSVLFLPCLKDKIVVMLLK